MVQERPSIQTLRTLIARRELRASFADQHCPTGIKALDSQLPGGGLRRGQLVEIFYRTHYGSGAWRFAFLLLAHMARKRVTAYLDSGPRGAQQARIYPPALAAMGVDLERLLVLKAADGRLAFWALEQLAQSSGLALSIAAVERLQSKELRRLQLGLEHSGALLLLLRPWRERGWRGTGASLRLLVSMAESKPAKLTRSRGLVLEVLRCPGRGPLSPVLMELDGVTGSLSSSSLLSC
jgi:hypothetical protein